MVRRGIVSSTLRWRSSLDIPDYGRLVNLSSICFSIMDHVGINYSMEGVIPIRCNTNLMRTSNDKGNCFRRRHHCRYSLLTFESPYIFQGVSVQLISHECGHEIPFVEMSNVHHLWIRIQKVPMWKRLKQQNPADQIVHSGSR